MSNTNLVYTLFDAALRIVLRLLPLTALTEKLALTWGYKYRPEPGLIKLRSGAMIYTTQVDHLQLLLYYFGTYEPGCLAAMRRTVRLGDTILDVGANIGLFTLEGSLAVGPTGRVMAIEPMPAHAKSVRASVRQNNLSNVEVIPVAVGNETGEGSLTLPSNTNYGMFTLGNVTGDLRFNVHIRRIDDIIAERRIEALDFVKIDIEGSELHALKGAEKTLKKFCPTILIELYEEHLKNCGTSSEEVKSFLTQLGYRESFLDGKLVKPGERHPVNECLFVHNSRRTL
ncbi:FkbM family methyltransferase [Bradyrhizobium lablabi]|uniref:FkbM family methyltransferase n=1 Tax=Bradyrhizobium lablabi TaxID=722472 RepID=UPI00090A4867|nr:FkbM family methyltransferase [Bradyrhizobium lablabi]SHK60143.1 methyltransferase, FkbM family [Bradyrhizobium lablabi]